MTVAREGRRARTKHLDVRALASPLSHPRFGIVVPKRHRTTVDRNRVKRRIREIVRLYLLQMAGSVDVVIRAQEQAYDAHFDELRTELVTVTQRLAQAVRKEGAS